MQAWRASGLRSYDFCEGRGFSAALLRHWAWRLGLTRRREPKLGVEQKQPIRLARVVVARRHTDARTAASAVGEGVEVQIGGARVHVKRDFDVETLTAVLDVLERRTDRQEQRR